MTIEERWAQLIAFIKVDYMLSDESERIINPIRNDKKYNLLCQIWQDCYDLSQMYKGKLDGNDPDFPMSAHFVKLVLPTENEEIIMGEIKNKFANAINNAEEVNIDTDNKGNIRIYFGITDIYTARET